MLRVQSKCISIERASGLVVWRRPGDEILWILLISLHKSKQHGRCADAIKLEGKKCWKELLTWTGWTVARKILANSWWPRRCATPRRAFGSFWEHAEEAENHYRATAPSRSRPIFYLCRSALAFSGFRISRATTAVTIVVMKSAGFTNFLDAIPRYDRWGALSSKLLYLLLYISTV